MYGDKMGYKTFINAVEITKMIMKEYVKPGYIALDCTVGNGNDTVLLASLVGQEGKVYGFDIQSIAIEVTGDKLKEEGLENRVTLIEDSHEFLDKYIFQKLDFIIYNLGYLPKGNKEIKTKASSTLKSIKKALPLLNSNGLMLVTCYRGHDGGMEEWKAIKNYFKSLNQKEYSVLEFNFVNQQNNPPILYGLEKNG